MGGVGLASSFHSPRNSPFGARAVTGAIFSLVMTLVLLLSSCGPGYEGERIDLSRPEERPTETPSALPRGQPVLRMAVAPVISPRETFTSSYQELLEYLGQKLGMPVELVQGKTYAEINDLVRSGDVTLAFVCTNPYLQGQEDFGMEALVVPEVDGKPLYYSYLIARSDSGIDSLDDLRGRVFAFSDPLSNSGRLAPVYQLALKGETPETFFKRYIFTYAHDNSIKAVAEGLVDGASVDGLVYDYWSQSGSEYTAKTKIVERWGPFGINPVVVHPALAPELKARLREALLGMDADGAGREILKSLRIDRFVLPDDSIYDSVREMRAYLSRGSEGSEARR